jgi:hypothetical protein
MLFDMNVGRLVPSGLDGFGTISLLLGVAEAATGK